MGALSKRKGTRIEHKVITWLEAQGYRVVRAAGSLGAFDLVAVRSLDMVLVQAKSNRWPGTVELERLREWPIPTNCRRMVVRWRDRKPEPDILEL